MAKANPFRFSTKHQDEETDLLYYGYRYLSTSTGRWINRDPIAERGGVNIAGFIQNDPVNLSDLRGLIIIGFYGADTPLTFPNPGNQRMMAIGREVGAVMFRSTAFDLAFRFLLGRLDTNKDGKYDSCDTGDQIRIFGHSWGGISAVRLAKEINLSHKFRNKDIVVVAVIDPVSTMRFPVTVPSNVQQFWNRYQTHGDGVVMFGRPVHGRRLNCNAQHGCEDQFDLNPGPGDNGVDHWNIIDFVQEELIGKIQ